jgi:hypothetical protein
LLELTEDEAVQVAAILNEGEERRLCMGYDDSLALSLAQLQRSTIPS